MCHLDRSEAEWRDLLYPPLTLLSAAQRTVTPDLSALFFVLEIDRSFLRHWPILPEALPVLD